MPPQPTCQAGIKCGKFCCNENQACKFNKYCREIESSSSSSEEDTPCRNDKDCSTFEKCKYPTLAGLGYCVPLYEY